MLLPSLKSQVLSRAASPDFYRLYRAGLEWSLIDHIAIETSDDLKSRPYWQGRIEPFRHPFTQPHYNLSDIVCGLARVCTQTTWKIAPSRDFRFPEQLPRNPRRPSCAAWWICFAGRRFPLTGKTSGMKLIER